MVTQYAGGGRLMTLRRSIVHVITTNMGGRSA